MKKGTFIIGILFLILFLSGQEIQEEAIAINIEVPVRVFTKGKFVEELNLEDFEVYEDGVLQKVEALYLIKRTVIERDETETDIRQERKIFIPETSRTFILVFEMMDYFPRIKNALHYFFDSVISPGDSLFVATPLKTYRLKKELLDKVPLDVIVDQLNGKLRKDIESAAREYKSMIKDLEWLKSTAEESLSDSIIIAGREILEKIGDFRYFDEGKLIRFNDQMEDIEGQKYVFLFYQQQIIAFPPVFAPSENDPSLLKKRIAFNVEKIKQSFSDSSIFINFIYLTKTEQHSMDMFRMDASDLVKDDISEETFGAFYEMAEATGGTTDSSANIVASFQKAVISSENYYLLYYTPSDYKSDGKFKNIKVKVKGKNYRITHRAGYIAD